MWAGSLNRNICPPKRCLATFNRQLRNCCFCESQRLRISNFQLRKRKHKLAVRKDATGLAGGWKLSLSAMFSMGNSAATFLRLWIQSMEQWKRFPSPCTAYWNCPSNELPRSPKWSSLSTAYCSSGAVSRVTKTYWIMSLPGNYIVHLYRTWV